MVNPAQILNNSTKLPGSNSSSIMNTSNKTTYNYTSPSGYTYTGSTTAPPSGSTNISTGGNSSSGTGYFGGYGPTISNPFTGTNIIAGSDGTTSSNISINPGSGNSSSGTGSHSSSGRSSRSSSNRNAPGSTTSSNLVQSVDPVAAQRQADLRTKLAGSTGGVYLTPGGQLFSSAKTLDELNKNAPPQIGTPGKNYLYTPSTGFENSYTRGKEFMGEKRFTKVSNVYETTYTPPEKLYKKDFPEGTSFPRGTVFAKDGEIKLPQGYSWDRTPQKVLIQEPIADVEARAREMVEEAKKVYAQNILAEKQYKQGAQIAYDKAQKYQQTMMDIATQKPTTLLTAKDIEKKTFYQSPKQYTPPIEIPSMPTFQTYESAPKDISTPTFFSELTKEYQKIEKQAGGFNLFITPQIEKAQATAAYILTPPTSIQEAIYKQQIGIPKRIYEQAYGLTSDVGGLVLNKGGIPELTKGLGETGISYLTYRQMGLLNPKQAALYDAQQRTGLTIGQMQSQFYTGKLVTEEAGFIIGGSAYIASVAGATSRVKEYKPEEVILPIGLGVLGRMATPIVSSKIETGLTKFNALTQKYSQKLLPKTPVLKNVLVPNNIPQITSSQLAKGLLIGAAGAEVAGLQFVPMDQKKEYIRQMSLYNAFTPIGYQVADVGIMAGKFGVIKGLDVGFTVSEKLGLKYRGESLRGFDYYKYSELSGGEDIMTTPTFVGSEKKLFESGMDITKPGAAKALYERYGINGTLFGIRSVSGKLTEEISPDLVYYEGTKFSFFSPGRINPIALRGAGLKGRLFGIPPGLKGEYSLTKPGSALELLGVRQATTISLKKGKMFTPKTYLDIKKIYGYSTKGMSSTFFDDVSLGGVQIPKGKTYGLAEYEKIIGGGLGRPLKSREAIGLLGREAFEKNFIDMQNSTVQRIKGFFSTPSRAIGATSELEFATTEVRVKAPSVTKAQKLFRKLGFSDAYVGFDFEAIPIQYEIPKLDLSPVLYRGYKAIDYSKKGIIQPTSLTITKTDYQYPLEIQNMMRVKPGQQGGLSQELEATFGKSKYGKKVLFSQLAPIKPFETKQKKEVVTTTAKEYSKRYGLTYELPYAPKYVPSYAPVYDLSYVSSYTPKYTPEYSIKYQPTYEPKYNPKYTPTYTPTYVPPYKPTYTPKYTPIYIPKYTPPYQPTYTPPYKPTYTPPTVEFRSLEFGGESTRVKAYIPKVKIKGKFIELSKTPLPYNLALKKAAQYARHTTSRSITVEQKGFTTQRDIAKETLFGFRKRKPKSKIRGEPVFIEESRYAINTIGEKLGLKQGKKRKGLFG